MAGNTAERILTQQPLHRSAALGADAEQSRVESRRRDCRAGRNDGGSENRQDTLASKPSSRPVPVMCRVNGPS